jgi:hypothetical protein
LLMFYLFICCLFTRSMLKSRHWGGVVSLIGCWLTLVCSLLFWCFLVDLLTSLVFYSSQFMASFRASFLKIQRSRI